MPATVAHDVKRPHAVLAHVRQVHRFEFVFEEPSVHGSPISVARSDHGRAIGILDFQPIPRRARPVRGAQPLRDNPLKTHRAGLPVDRAPSSAVCADSTMPSVRRPTIEPEA